MDTRLFRYERPYIKRQKDRDYTKLIEVLENLLDAYEECELEPCLEIDSDLDEFVLEAVLECFYGKNIFNYMDERV